MTYIPYPKPNVIPSGYHTISISNSGERSIDTIVSFPNNHKLGLVQSVTWKADIHDVFPKCIIETILTPAELTALVENTEIRYTLIEQSGSYFKK